MQDEARRVQGQPADGPGAVRTRLWRNGTLEAENFPLERFSDYLDQPDCVVWADVLRPDHETLLLLANELRLDEHAIEDAVSANERPKVVRYATHFFLTAYAVGPHEDLNELALGRVSAFSVQRGVVTVRLDDCLDIDAVIRRWDDNADLIKFGPRAILYGLLDELVDRYFDVMQNLDDATEDIEDLLFAEDSGAEQTVSRRTFELRRAAVQMRRVIVPMRDAIATIMHRATNDNVPELMPYYEDLYDHILRAAEWTDQLRDTVSSIFETNMQLNDTRMNVVMKKLTAWAAIIAVPTAITGYFGQNVPYPGFDRVWGFWLSAALIVGIGLALYVWFRRSDWI